MEESLMESRGQKRPETSDELHVDKRACNSVEFRPSSSSMTPDAIVTPTSSDFDPQEEGMETSSSPSASGQSEADEERDSPYNSDDSNDMNDADHRYSSLREYQRSQSSRDSSKFNGLISSLSNDGDPSVQLVALTELCELLSFAVGDSITTTLTNQLAPLLVKLAKHESNPEIILLAIRALTYLCDVSPRSATCLVSHNALPALCQRLMIIEYLDVAEQCLQALEKISRDQPVPCLESGAIMAVLGYIDFFSTTVQRTALRTAVNICKKLPSERSSLVMEAVPRLCNLLQYEDLQLVELVVTCLIKIVDRVKGSREMLGELYNHGLIDQATHLINLNSRITLSQPTYTGLVMATAQIASGSTDAVRSLFELNIGSILKDALSNSDLSHGILSSAVDKNCNQVHEILKLLHELLPKATRGKKTVLSSKEKLLLDHPDKLQKFGTDIFPTLAQMVNSGANTSVCYGCLSVISRLVHFSKSDSLFEMLKEINVASFLAAVFTRNDHHVLSLALQITEIVLDKLSNILMQAFIKEGVLFAIDALLMPQSCSQQTSPILDCIQSGKKTGKGAMRCLCYDYRPSRLVSTSKSKACKLDKESVHIIAERIKTKYFSVELLSSQGMVTGVLQDLRYSSAAITDLLTICTNSEASAHIEEKLGHILDKVIHQLTGNEPISTFELIESGIVKALLSYLSNGLYLSKKYVPDDDVRQMYDVQKRFQAFARIILSKDLPISLLVRKLQHALSTVETFPTIVGCTARQRGSYATVPTGRHTTYPCFRVRFVKREEELSLNNYATEVVTVDPFCKVDEIEQHLISKVCSKKVGAEGSPQACPDPKNASIEDPVYYASIPGKSEECVGSERLYNPSPDMQEEGDGKSHWSPMDTSELRQTTIDGSKVMGEGQSGSSEDEIHSSEANTNLIAAGLISGDEEHCKEQCKASSSVEDAPSKLVLYLEEEPLEYSSTLYQEVFQRQMKPQHELRDFSKLWSTTYTLSYKRVKATEARIEKQQNNLHDNGASEKVLPLLPVMPRLFNSHDQRLGSTVDPKSPVSDILHLLRSLETMNRLANDLLCYERLNAFGNGSMDDLDGLKAVVHTVSRYEFVSNKLTEKLEQQMRDPSAMHIGALPLWCSHLMFSCPFLFSFEARCKYFQLAAFGRQWVLPNIVERRSSSSSVPRKKFAVVRDQILESATQMMELYAQKNVVIEVEYIDEVGTGLGPTLEFYTLVCHDFQKNGLGMWRGDYMSPTMSYCQQGTSLGLFPRPWSPKSSNINGIEFADVIKRFILLGQIVGKALHDGRVLDIPFSKAFYKLVLGKELSICDIQTFDPELGRTLLEFQALVDRRRFLEVGCTKNVPHGVILGFRGSSVEDLCLDFTLPGYPDYILASETDDNMMVSSSNLEDYLCTVLDATLYSGISKQVEAFKSGLNQVFSDKHLYLYTEDELERLLCGEHDSWSLDLFDHIKFDHGYTASSPQIINLLEVVSEFDYEQRRAFLQFVTGAPRLPPGGLAALNPKMTIVRKLSSNSVDADLPSVMTCANYLKLPPYSSKEKMKEKLLYAITEGQGSFHLS
ncbi:E3 ubiquitin-protein ligase UPL4 isoform X2 [Silene latifolia]|uniref:E3 ubiquitin-protein ligase UPL4 isoform X2 n=1 Tax=Silene latifolia TaxID=37657 RepID=UPI003D77DFFE